MEPLELTLYVLKFGLAFVPLAIIPLMIFLERKGAAVIQDRPGPNRAALDLWFVPKPLRMLRGFGMVHNFTDVVKLLFKEDFVPARAHKWFYLLAPAIPVVTAVLTPALIPWFAAIVYESSNGVSLLATVLNPVIAFINWIIPFGDPFSPISAAGVSGFSTVSGAVIDAHSSLLLLFAMGALSVYGIVLGSWGSNSKFSLLGGLRASAMMISYEVSMGLSVLGLILIVGTFSLSGMVAWQAEHTWGLVVQPVGFLLFLVSMFAETNRTPFDVAEGESEIVGFHTEYSAIKFALFFMGEYAHIVVASALLATAFCGGWDLWPWAGGGADTVQAHLGVVLGALLLLKFTVLVFISRLIHRQKRRYAALAASDQQRKRREYGFMRGVVALLALLVLAAAIASFVWIGEPQPLVDAAGAMLTHEGAAVYPAWVALLAAAVQFGVVMLKTLFFCWLFIWVRWTLPRLRYDQIMSLGWKVMLNIALVNLVATAVIAKWLQGGDS